MSKAKTPKTSAAKSAELHRRFETYLSEIGMKQTRQRRVILDAILAAGSHSDTETIAAEARKQDSSVGIATVYRTLQLLTKSGLVEARHFDNERSTFELSEEHGEHHDHLICTECGAIVEFVDPKIEALQEEIASRLGFELTRHRLELFGKCLNAKSCRRDKTKSKS